VRSILDKYRVRPEYPVDQVRQVVLVVHFRLAVRVHLGLRSGPVSLVVHHGLVHHCRRVGPTDQRHRRVRLRRDLMANFVLVDQLHPVLHRCLAVQVIRMGRTVLVVQVGRCCPVVHLIQVDQDFLAIHLVRADPADRADMGCMVELELPRKRLVVDRGDQVHLALLEHPVCRWRPEYRHDPDDLDDSNLRIRLDV